MAIRKRGRDNGASRKVCEYCGDPLEVFKSDPPLTTGKQISITLMCACVRRKIKRQRKSGQVQDRLRILRERGFQTGQYARMTMKNWRNGNVGAHVVEATDEYIHSVDLNHRNWLYMYGDYGVGKTHIAVALTRKLTIGRNWRPALLRWAEYCDLIQQSWSDESIKLDWNLARAARILVLDDIDKKAATQWTLSKLYDVIDSRCVHNLPTIITANRGVGELSKFWSVEGKNEDLSKAIISRIMGQLARVIHFKGEDYRFCKDM